MNDSNAPAHDDDDDRDRRALAWWSDPALYGPGGWTVRDAEIARAVLRRRIQSGEPEPTETYGGKGMTDELRALADEWARELIDERGLDLLDIERFGAVLVDRARNRIQSGTGEGAGDAGSKRKGRVRR